MLRNLSEKHCMWRERARKMQAAWTSLEVILEFYININKAEQNSRTCMS
jgi:hypothetical protein